MEKIQGQYTTFNSDKRRGQLMANVPWVNMYQHIKFHRIATQQSSADWGRRLPTAVLRLMKSVL
jgi:hypothetical protein